MATTSLDHDLRESRLEKYAKLEAEVRLWLCAVLEVPLHTQEQYSSRGLDLIEMLKDGALLCQLGNRLGPNYPTRRFKSSRMPFVQMENISFFLQTCELVGVAHDEIFQTADLFDRRDPYQVLVTLMAFSRRAHELEPKVAAIGPKAARVKPRVPFKPVGLRHG